MASHWLPLVLVIATARATMLSLPSAPAPEGGLCHHALQITEDRLLALQADLDARSEALQDLRLTFDRVLQLLDIDVLKSPGGSGYAIDGLGNSTVVEVVTLGLTDEGEASEGSGSGSSSDDEDGDVNYSVNVEVELETSNTPETDEQLSGDGEDLGTNLEGSGLPGDDEGLETNLEGSGLPGDDEGLETNLEGSGLPGDDEDLETNLEGSA